MKSIKLRENIIAQVSDVWFKASGWDLFPEAVLPGMSNRPDFIGKRNNACMVVECKESLTITVIEQLCRWQVLYNQLKNTECTSQDSLMIPHVLWAVTGPTGINWGGIKGVLLEKYRIGWLTVEYYCDIEVTDESASDLQKELVRRFNSKYPNDGEATAEYVRIKNSIYRVTERLAPKLQHRSHQLAQNILKHLNDDMKCAIPGETAANSNFMTPFKRTLLRAHDVLLASDKALSSSEILTGVKLRGGHHYASDKSFTGSIGEWLVKKGLANKVSEYPHRYLAIK
ncbi:TPA: hypothetical protein ACX6RX_003180 [Photobacterium damselae]